MAITLQAIKNSDGTNVDAYVCDVDVTSVSTQRYFPRKVEHTLMSGNLVTYTPNEKTQLTIDLQFLSKAHYEYIMNNTSNRFKIISEDSNNHPISTEKYYLYSGDILDFSYSNQFKGSGFTGTLNFIETYYSETTT